MGLSVKNFSAQNTPEGIEKFGNYCLLASAIGVVILSLPASVAALVPTGTPALVLPSILVSVATWAVGLGVVGKVITKFFGSNE